MMTHRTRLIRWALRWLGRIAIRLLTRTTITGREHLQTPGQVIYSGNHTSTFDALFLLTMLPSDTALVGPGDFKLLWPANWVIELVGLILAKRGSVDRDSLKQMLDVLKGGGRLALFPEGGTWEKPIDDVKSGVSYLSHATGAAIVPMGFGGTYQVWRQIARLRRPRVTVRIGPPLPPVTVSGDRARRQDELQASAVDLMWRIYDLLPPDTQAHYDRMARLQFSGRLLFDSSQLAPPDVSLDALAELVSKPNLFSPLVHNARLPVKPFLRPRQFFPAREMRAAASALLDAFSTGDFAGYLEYRLGEDKADQVRAALRAIAGVMDEAEKAGVKVSFQPVVNDAVPVERR
jgi:1-acyl-sn-glycerol-3-phosphate acyltransferase